MFKLSRVFFQIMMRIKIYITILIIGLALGKEDQPAVLHNIDISAKENGLIVEFEFSSNILIDYASGWYAHTEWFYVTVLNTSIDSTMDPYIKKTPYINDIQFDQVGESIQISLKLSVPPDNHEFYQRTDKKQIFLLLRSPIKLISKSDPITDQENQISAAKVTKPKLFFSEEDNKIQLMGYFIGISFTISGILQEDSKSSGNWELPTGVAIFLGTYVYDKYFVKQKIFSIEELEENNRSRVNNL